MKQEINSNRKLAFTLSDVKLARGHTFVCTANLRGSTVIDGGAHRCEFAGIMVNTYGAKVIALEPNTALPVEHRHSNIALIRAALSDNDREGPFFIDENPEGSSIVYGASKQIKDQKSVPIKFRSLRSLMEEFDLDEIGLLKLDIEGAEFAVIQSIDESLASVIHQITVEFHPASPRGDDVTRMEDAFAHLLEQGFHMCRSSFRGYGDVLFLNSRYFAKPSKGFRALLPYFRKALERKLIGSGTESNGID